MKTMGCRCFEKASGLRSEMKWETLWISRLWINSMVVCVHGASPQMPNWELISRHRSTRSERLCCIRATVRFGCWREAESRREMAQQSYPSDKERRQLGMAASASRNQLAHSCGNEAPGAVAA